MRAVLAVFAASLLAQAGFGQMVLQSQSRTISARARNGPLVTASAPDFGEFNQSVTSPSGPPPNPIAFADQRSTLTASRLAGRGSATPDLGAAYSDCRVEFDVAAPCTFVLHYQGSGGTLSLTGPGTAIGYGYSDTTGLRSGVLSPGRYTVVAHTDGRTQQLPPLPGNFDFTLDVTLMQTAFTYQGRLESAGAPVEGTADFRFSLFRGASGAEQVGSTLQLTGAAVTKGLFAAELDFGQVMDGSPRYLEIAVRSPSGAGAYTTLSPREPLNPTPHAVWSLAARSAEQAQFATAAETAQVAESAAVADTAVSAQTAVSANTARNVPWSGVTGVPANVSGAFSPFTADANGITCAEAVGIGGAAPAYDTLGVWGGITVDAGQQNTGGPPPAAGEYRGVRFGHPTSGEAIGSARGAGQPTQYGLDFYTGRAMRMSILNSGRVGINTTAPDATLSVNGTASKPGGGSWAAFCDPRLKHDVRPMTGTLDTLLTLHGYTFEYNADAVESGRALPGVQIGLMADEVERVFPGWITRAPDGMRMVTERATTALMVEALRDLRAEKDREIEALRAELADRDRALADLRGRIEAIEKAK